MVKIDNLDNEGLKKLCLQLLKLDDENDVIEKLAKYGIKDQPEYWTDYGKEPSNYSIIGGQQSTSDRALVEKLTNSIDAMLMLECLKKGLDPESDKSPNSIGEALKEFYNMKNGKLSDLDDVQQKSLAENIQLIATGDLNSPSISIIDKGEGQSPSRMQDTFLSLMKSNKTKIKFVQGAYNMGSTGSLRFCGKKNIQLIISKRNPTLTDKKNKDHDKWSFSVIRKFPPRDGEKNIVYRYLTLNNEVLNFASDGLKILPEISSNQNYENQMNSGSYVKMFNYALPPGLKSNINKDLTKRLDALLIEPALPITVLDRRDYENEKSFKPGYVRGIEIKLFERKENRLEENFPSSGSFSLRDTNFIYKIYAFKDNNYKRYFSKDSIMLTLNGQAHGFLSSTFLARRGVGLSHVKDLVIMSVDCSQMSRDLQTEIFMTSRDRLLAGELKDELEAKIENVLGSHKGLEKLNLKIRTDKASQVGDDTVLYKTVETIINEPIMRDVIRYGRMVSRTVETYEEDEEKVSLSFHPSMFKVANDYTKDTPRVATAGKPFAIKFDTDVANDYFDRISEPGSIEVKVGGKKLEEGKFFNKRLWNGEFHLMINNENEFTEQELLDFEVTVNDNENNKSFNSNFYVEVKKPKPTLPKNGVSNSSPKRPRVNRGVKTPNINRIFKDMWNYHNFDRFSIGYAIPEDDDFNVYINMDSDYVKSELMNADDRKREVFTFAYSTMITLFSLVYVNKLKREALEKEWDVDVEHETRLLFDAIGPTLIPVVRHILTQYEKI